MGRAGVLAFVDDGGGFSRPRVHDKQILVSDDEYSGGECVYQREDAVIVWVAADPHVGRCGHNDEGGAAEKGERRLHPVHREAELPGKGLGNLRKDLIVDGVFVRSENP